MWTRNRERGRVSRASLLTVVVDDCRDVFPAIAMIAAVKMDIC